MSNNERAPKKKRSWPWMIGVLALLLVCAIIAIGSSPDERETGRTVEIPESAPIEGAQPTETSKPTRTLKPTATSSGIVMYFCEIERCKLSPSYGLVFDPQGTPVWQNHDPDRGRVLRMADHHEKIRVIREIRVRDGWGGLWYELEGGGWTNDFHLTDEPCTPENIEQYSISDC